MSVWENLLIATISAIIGGYISYCIAKYQVKHSEDQDRIQREDEIKNQRLFMFEELKIKSTEKMLESTASVNSNVINIMDLGNEKHDIHLKTRGGNHDRNSSAITKINKNLQYNFDELQNYLSDLFTVINLFDIEKETLNFNEFQKKIKLFYQNCFDADLYNSIFDEDIVSGPELELCSSGQECIDTINEIDYVVRKAQIDLIKSMQKE